MKLKKFTKSMIGDGWKDERNKLYKLKSEMEAKSREEVEATVSDGVDRAQWRGYIGWRMTELGRPGKRAARPLGHSNRLLTRLGAYR